MGSGASKKGSGGEKRNGVARPMEKVQLKGGEPTFHVHKEPIDKYDRAGTNGVNGVNGNHAKPPHPAGDSSFQFVPHNTSKANRHSVLSKAAPYHTHHKSDLIKDLAPGESVYNDSPTTRQILTKSKSALAHQDAGLQHRSGDSHGSKIAGAGRSSFGRDKADASGNVGSPTHMLLMRASEKLQKMMDPDPQEEVTGLQRLVALLNAMQEGKSVNTDEVALLKRALLNGHDLHVPVTMAASAERSHEFYSRYDDVTATWLRDMFVGTGGGGLSGTIGKGAVAKIRSGDVDNHASRSDSARLSSLDRHLTGKHGSVSSHVGHKSTESRMYKSLGDQLGSSGGSIVGGDAGGGGDVRRSGLHHNTMIDFHENDGTKVLEQVAAALQTVEKEQEQVAAWGTLDGDELSLSLEAPSEGKMVSAEAVEEEEEEEEYNEVPEMWWTLGPTEFAAWKDRLLGRKKGQGVPDLRAQLGGGVHSAFVAASSASYVSSGLDEAAARDDVQEQLSIALTEWSCDSIPLLLSHASPLMLLAGRILEKWELFDRLPISRPALLRFLFLVEEGYPDPRSKDHNNPYHNRAHAMDVVQATHVMIEHSGLRQHVDDLDILAMIIAAAVHDFRHPGLNNDFLMRTSTRLAITYNDRSVLENFHLSSAFELMQDEGCNFIADLEEEERGRFRRLVIELVLSTDLKRHFELLSQFRLKIGTMVSAANAGAGDGGVPERPPPTILSKEVTASSGGIDTPKSLAGDAPGQSFGWTVRQVGEALEMDESTRILAMQVAVKLSDLSHLTKPRDIHVRWVMALQEEFCRQGDLELEMGLEPSPLNKRGRRGVVSSQVGFFEVIVLPIFRTWASVFPDYHPVLEALESNYRYWKDLDMPHAE